MSERRLPVRPDLNQLKNQAKDLLRRIRAGDHAAIAEFETNHPERIDPASTKLADAQLALARSYQAPSWPRLARACQLVEAIWNNDLEGVRELVTKYPNLLHESVLIRESNWGPPMSYAANLGRDRIIEVLRELGATDVMQAFNRAVLQSQVATARRLYEMAGQPRLDDRALHDAAYTLSAPGTALLLELGARVYAEDRKPLAPVAVVLETDSRNPAAKHEILDMYVRNGFRLPDTPTMAVHRGRIDLLEKHLRHDPQLLRRTFTYEEIWPPEISCSDIVTHGTPLAGATLLHMAVDYDEMEIAKWLLERKMDVDAKAGVDKDGFGGHTALFSTVVSQPNFWMNHLRKPQVAPFTELLLEHGADPNARASLHKQLHPGYGPDTMHEYRNVTPVEWGERFHRKIFVNEPAISLIRERQK
jgi:hypothetical protein